MKALLLKALLLPSPSRFCALALLISILTSCAVTVHAADLQATAQGIVNSDEYRIQSAQNLYQKFLGRSAKPAEASALSNQLKAGGKAWLTAIVKLAGSAEYFQRAGNTNEKFVSRLFQDLVGRAPDAQEESPAALEFLTAGNTRQSLAEVIADTDEFRTNLVEQYYQKLLRRAATEAEAATGAKQLETGGVNALVVAIISSPEYFKNRGKSTQDGWRSALNQDLLGGAGDAGETDDGMGAGTGELGGPAMTPGPVPDVVVPTSTKSPAGNARLPLVQAILTSPEYLTNMVQGYYQKFLRRAATPTELSNWVGALQKGGTADQVMADILTSDEYFNRAGGTTNAFLNRLSQDLLGQPSASGKSGKNKTQDLLDVLRNLPRKQ